MIEPAPPGLLPWAPQDESRLDVLLLAALDGEQGAVADVFAESSCLASGAARIERSSEDVPALTVRVDEGIAVRRVTPSVVRHWHASGRSEEATRRLQAALVSGRLAPSSSEAMSESSSVALDAFLAESAALVTRGLALFREAARCALEAEPRGFAVDCEITVVRRAVHALSSEWGHATDQTTWAVVRITATTLGADGHPVQARRGAGAPLLAALTGTGRPGGEPPPVARLAHEALAAAAFRGDRRPSVEDSPAVILAAGAGGVLVHEAVGHALEADVVERGASYLCGRAGERVAVRALTVLDDPARPGLAGSYVRDDEGTLSAPTLLLEHGVQRGQLSDGLRTAFRQGLSSGHARRASYRDPPLPRMANTLVLPGDEAPEDIIGSTPRGILVTRLERAAVDASSGDVHFRVREGFLVEDGRVTAPLAETDLSGSAPSVLWAIDALGGDLAFDDGSGTCGRAGQWLRVAVGQPTLRIAAGALRVR